MGKFNVVQKDRRAAIRERKRAKHGDPLTRKLKHKDRPNHLLLPSISGKRKRKLFKIWRREQKEAVEKGVITMEDVEMATVAADITTTSSSRSSKQQVKFDINEKKTRGGRRRRLKIRDMTKKKKKQQGRKSDKGFADAMEE